MDGIEVRSKRDYYTHDGRILDWKVTSAWSGMDLHEGGNQLGRRSSPSSRTSWLSAPPSNAASPTATWLPIGAAVVLIYRDWSPGMAARKKDWPQTRRQMYVYPEDKWDVKAVRRGISFPWRQSPGSRSCMGEARRCPPELHRHLEARQEDRPSRSLLELLPRLRPLLSVRRSKAASARQIGAFVLPPLTPEGWLSSGVLFRRYRRRYLWAT